MITKLIIKNNTALSKKGVTSIELDTKEIFNVIVGRNGFGKTTLMKEITMFPPDNADYLPGGYKEVHAVVGKDTYRVCSTTGKSSEHYFYHNGKNLNEGNTLLVQRKLVEIHFGVTQFVKDVITGLDVRDLFTTLSSAKRKEFLMAVNPNDTSYALRVYDKLRSNLNALKGGLKTQRQRLVVEESRLTQLASMDPTKLQEEIRVMDDQIKNALIIHGTLQNIQRNDLTPLKDEIGQITSFLMSSHTQVQHSKPTLLSLMEKAEGTLDYYKTREIKLSSLLGELSGQLSGLDLANNNLDSYKQRLSLNRTAIEINLEELESIKRKFNDHPSLKSMLGNQEFCSYINEFITYLQGVDRTNDPNITSAGYKQTQVRSKELSDELHNVKRQITDINHTLEHYNRADAVDCPKCEHRFKVGVKDINPAKLTNERNTLSTRQEALEKEIKEVNDWLNDNYGWFESMGGLTRYASRHVLPKLIIELITEYRVGRSDISVLLDLLRSMVIYGDVTQTLLTLYTETETVEKQIAFLESSDVETLFKRSQYVERELGATQRSVSRVLGEIKDYQKQLDIIALDEQKRDRLGYAMQELEDKLAENGQWKIKNRVEEIIQDLSPRKDQLISNLIRAESLNSVIQSIKDNIADMQKREKHTNLLLDGLSPVKGLIGYLMNDFLKSVIANVNAIIQPVWTNRLHVLNCSTSKSEEDVDLSYNFPVLSGGSDKTNKDIGNCSGGEREIINFAFRITMLRYIGERACLPLMMDEVGVAFDELHRGRFCSYIAEQLRLDKLPQTFLISHYINQYGVFKDANIIALNTEGLSIPFAVNKNSKIK